MAREPDAKRLADAYAKAVSKRDEAAGKLEAAKLEAAGPLDDLAAKLGLGSITPSVFEAEKAKITAAVDDAQATFDLAESVVESLGRKAADAAEQEAAEAVEKNEQAVVALQRDQAELERELAAVRSRQAEASESLAFARTTAARARWPFEPDDAKKRGRVKADAELIEWHVRSNPRERTPWPLHLRAAIVAGVEARRREYAAAAERQREASATSLVRAGFRSPPIERVER